jgi:hypothetical protein
MSAEQEFTNLLTLREEHIDDHNLIRLWVVRWNWGNHPVLEKRRIWIDKEGVERTRKAVGMTKADVEYISEHQQEIISILEGNAYNVHKNSSGVY